MYNFSIDLNLNGTVVWVLEQGDVKVKATSGADFLTQKSIGMPVKLI